MRCAFRPATVCYIHYRRQVWSGFSITHTFADPESTPALGPITMPCSRGISVCHITQESQFAPFDPILSQPVPILPQIHVLSHSVPPHSNWTRFHFFLRGMWFDVGCQDMGLDCPYSSAAGFRFVWNDDQSNSVPPHSNWTMFRDFFVLCAWWERQGQFPPNGGAGSVSLPWTRRLSLGLG
ncbi:hypothetical protein RSAG8_09030, partial [Rhizoctonia solani AG-8 WAC10335]